ncbi:MULTISPECIES: hypothetical protein [Streptomyces]|uniref:Uncharacterized protein n=1 Tax=Streptomyces doudnae TaxID=3075536 RepID=A0ABD5EPK6_9ACTN|nr:MULTISPECIES: hypothetical protein [unclassified Streptomyces]MDT0435639.1 hypothetical protein [Streptomyces sp. DSM 41981]MYQ62593.1 hypothetical protein [Streptomyces sp. SID4950]SCD40475.1 hypothetical protein GA0115242_104898 [Streptomyces sp. SolWspMP-5a-2]
MFTLAAPGALAKGNWLGTITLSGIALIMFLALCLGVSGSNRIPINTKERITGWALVTGSVCLAAGGNWRDVITGLGSIPASTVQQSGFNDPGAGGMAIALTLLAVGPGWKRKWIPAVLALAASMYFVEAGGIGAIILNAARTTLGNLGSPS